MEKFQHKYRIPSARLRTWDYRWAGVYFITICTQNHECYFGGIENGEMQLSEIGCIVEQEWLKTFDMRPDMNLQMGAFVVMPNHFHAIVIIGENEYNQRGDEYDDQWDERRDDQWDDQRDDQRDTHRRDAMHCVSTNSQLPSNT